MPEASRAQLIALAAEAQSRLCSVANALKEGRCLATVAAHNEKAEMWHKMFTTELNHQRGVAP